MANELSRDNGNILGNENLTFVVDTFHDRRNGFLFQTNALGGLRDMAITDDLQNDELFLVCSDGRNTLAPGVPAVLNQSLAIKVTRLIRF